MGSCIQVGFSCPRIEVLFIDCEVQHLSGDRLMDKLVESVSTSGGVVLVKLYLVWLILA